MKKRKKKLSLEGPIMKIKKYMQGKKGEWQKEEEEKRGKKGKI